MRKHIPIIALVILFILPSLASAVYLDSVTGTADCNGWNADVEVTFRSGARSVRIEYTVVLLDGNGLEIDRFLYSEPVEIPSQDTVVYSFGEPWSTVLEGTHSMTADFVLFDIFPDGTNRFEDGFTADFTCGGTDESVVTDFCPRGQGYWKNHPADWPVMDLDLGATTLGQAALLEILSASPRGDATVILARALIAAKLNRAAGAGDEIDDTVVAADVYLSEHPVFSKPGKADRHTALSFMSPLGAYNSGECAAGPENENDGPTSAAGKYDSMGLDKAAAEEVTSMGSLKALYR
jgi:hypothetical protein